MKEYKGLYAYQDTKNNKIVYIGKDSHLHKKIRHSQHHQPAKYNSQRINEILQNNPGRYEYVELIRLNKDITDEELNEYEKKYIAMYNPKFNFTEGGDGFGSGENNPNYGKCGEESPHYKNYARVIKGGNKEGKQTYSLEYKSTTLTTSINKKELQILAEKINEGKDPESLLKKPLAVINKEGIKRGKQYYSIIYNKKRIKMSADKELLQKIVKDINNGEAIDSALIKYNTPKPPYVSTAGKTEDGKPYYVLRYGGKKLKRSPNKKLLQKMVEDIINGEDVKKVLTKYNTPKAPYITTCGKKHGKTCYDLRYNGKRVKTSINKESLQKIIDSEEYIKIYERKYSDK